VLQRTTTLLDTVKDIDMPVSRRPVVMPFEVDDDDADADCECCPCSARQMDEDHFAYRSAFLRKFDLVQLCLLDVSSPCANAFILPTLTTTPGVGLPTQPERILHSNAQGVQPGRHPLDLVCVQVARTQPEARWGRSCEFRARVGPSCSKVRRPAS